MTQEGIDPHRRLAHAAILYAVCLLSVATPLLGQQDPPTAQPRAETQETAEASAADPSFLYARFKVGAGFFASFFNTQLRVDSEELGVGTEIDLEDDLGFSTRKFDFRGGGYWRLGVRHRITFGYFSLARNSTKVIEEEIQFGDDVFEVDTEVEAQFSSAVPSLGYKFSFIAHPKVEASVGIGLSAQITKTSLSAVGSVDGEDIDAQSEQKNVTLPIANFNVGATWNPIQRFLVSGFVGGLYVKISDIEASVGTASVNAEYYFLRNLGVGAGYSYVKLGAENTSGNTIDVTYRYSGILVYAIGAFF